MKKVMMMLVAAMMAVPTFAQSAIELAEQQAKLNNVNSKLLKQKPTKEAKKQAKELKKAGWIVPAGERSIEMQITESMFYSAELMADENGSPVKRYILQTSIITAGDFTSGHRAAVANAQTELAALIEREIVSGMEIIIDNSQTSAINASTVNKFHERAKAIVDQAITNSVTVLNIYRVLPNNNVEVQVCVAFDRKEIAARVKRNMVKELELEGDEDLKFVDEAFKKKF